MRQPIRAFAVMSLPTSIGTRVRPAGAAPDRGKSGRCRRPACEPAPGMAVCPRRRRRGHGSEQDLSGYHGGAGGPAARRDDHHVRRLRPVRHPGRPDRGDPRQRREGPDGDLQQRRDRRRRAGPAARHPPDPQDDQLLRRRERHLRAPVPGRGAGDRVQSPGHPGGADPRRRRRHPGLLHRDRGRHRHRQGQGDEGIRRPAATSWNAA